MKQPLPLPKTVRFVKYLYSLPILIVYVKNWPIIPLGFLGLIALDKGQILKLTNGLKFKITHILDVLTVQEICTSNDYRFSCNDKKLTIIDIGANIGTFSILVASRNHQVKIHSYEPSRSTYSLLRQNIKLNNLDNQITTHRLAVYKKNTNIKLFTSGPSGLKSLYQTRNEKKYETVPTITLKDIFVKNKIKACHFLKLDCEGAEYDILLSTPKSIFNKINQIALEFHELTPNQHHHDLVKHLKANNFKVRHKYHSIEHNIGYIYAKK